MKPSIFLGVRKLFGFVNGVRGIGADGEQINDLLGTEYIQLWQ